MIPNVDNVDLWALDELAPAVGLDENWSVYVSPPGSLIGYKDTIENLAAVVSGQIGAAIERPDRVYRINVDMPAGSSLLIDEDPGSPTFGQAIGVIDPYLDGLDYNNHRRGIELLIKGDEWQNDVVGGGWRLTQVGDTLADGEIITLSFKPQISNVIVTPDAIAKFSNGVQVINASTTLTDAANRKIIYANSFTGVLSITLNATYPENVMCLVIAAEGGQKQMTINAPVGQTFRQAGSRPAVYLNEGESAIFIRIGTVWYVHGGESWRNRLAVKLGGLPFRGALTPGTTYLRAEYPGTWEAIFELSVADPDAVVSGAEWLTNPTKWSSGDGSTTFITPDYVNTYPRFGDSDNSHGDYLAQELLEHDHGASDDNADARFVLRDPPPGPKPGLIATNPVASYEYMAEKTGKTGGAENRPNSTIFTKYYFHA